MRHMRRRTGGAGEPSLALIGVAGVACGGLKGAWIMQEIDVKGLSRNENHKSKVRVRESKDFWAQVWQAGCGG